MASMFVFAVKETFLLLAQKVEERMVDALLRHCKCRGIKLSIDRAYAERKATTATDAATAPCATDAAATAPAATVKQTE